MKSTHYLTGHSKERYKPLLEPLATMRINDMLILKKELVQLSRLTNDQDKIKEYQARYNEVVKAIEWWRELIEKD